MFRQEVRLLGQNIRLFIVTMRRISALMAEDAQAPQVNMIIYKIATQLMSHLTEEPRAWKTQIFGNRDNKPTCFLLWRQCI